MPLVLQNEAYTPSKVAEKSVVTFTPAVTQGDTATYSVQLRGPGGAPIANTDFTLIELTLIDERTHISINDRVDQDVLDAAGAKLGQNDVVITAAALLTWSITTDDTPIVDQTEKVVTEWHRAIFKMEYDIGAGAERTTHEVRLPVRRRFTAFAQTIS